MAPLDVPKFSDSMEMPSVPNANAGPQASVPNAKAGPQATNKGIDSSGTS